MTKSNRQDDMRDYIIHPDNVQTSVKHGQLRFEMELTGSIIHLDNVQTSVKHGELRFEMELTGSVACRVYDVALD